MFSPEELESRSFVFVRRGYDPDEVSAYLRAVAEDIRRLQDELASVRAEAKANAQPLDGAMADAVAVMQAARESAARIESQAEQRALDRISRAETDAERRLERARAEVELRRQEAQEQAAAVVAEATAARAAAEAEAVALRASADAEAAAIRQAAMREVAELDMLARRRRRVLEDAQENLELWMVELRDIIRDARDAGDGRTQAPADGETEVPAQVDAEVEGEHPAAQADEAYPQETSYDVPEQQEQQEQQDGLGWPGHGRAQGPDQQAEIYDVV